MIELAPDFDLGLDATRIKDPDVGARQARTARALLERLFHSDPRQRYEIQLLADEVGMGKTFVALAVAYSVLDAMRNKGAPADLDHCYRKVLVLTPPNGALFNKWHREVSEFRKRCVAPELRHEAGLWFAPEKADRIDTLVAALRKPGRGPSVIISRMDVFSGRKIRHYDLKRRSVLAALFTLWGKRLRLDQRERLLRGAPERWGRDPATLGVPWAGEEEHACFEQRQLLGALRRIERTERRGGATSSVSDLLELCRAIAAPYARDREQRFREVETRLTDLYRRASLELLNSDLPLVIVDEAHNWKRGPSAGTYGYRQFAESIAANTRRILLLTATPFQLRPDEMLQILRMSDGMAPAPTRQASEQRTHSLEEFRERVVRPVLEAASTASTAFARAWGRLPASVGTAEIEAAWGDPKVHRARRRLDELAEGLGALEPARVKTIATKAVEDLDPSIRALLREALRLYGHNRDLSSELGRLVVRHRRSTTHRLVRVGEEYRAPWEPLVERQGRDTLHAAPGLDVRGETELPHYLLMRCVSELKKGKGRSSLGSNLTGCWSTLAESADGRKLARVLDQNPTAGFYFEMLRELTGEDRDASHPKVRAVVDEVVESWRRGEKSLIFCFRTHTARRLRDIIDERIREELAKRARSCLGGEQALPTLRRRLTGRDRDLIVLGLDRVLWSFLWASRDGALDELDGWGPCPWEPADLELTDSDFVPLAALLLQAGEEPGNERLNRIRLHRATEIVLARRIRERYRLQGQWQDLVDDISDETWLELPYGTEVPSDPLSGSEEGTSVDERGVNARYPLRAVPDDARIAEFASELSSRRQRAAQREAATSVLDVYARGPSLWLGPDPMARFELGLDHPASARSIASIHRHLAHISVTPDGIDWAERAIWFKALRRALLREAVLLRILPNQAEQDEGSWGELLAEKFHASLPGQSESMADRIGIFLEDIRASSGSVHEADSARHALLGATQLSDQSLVALVTGSRDAVSRERAFAGFNTPLLPEVLVCTSVGQEGIDLHRHCRHIIHYDLAWNPAVIEQRTGRIDRIGSKTDREHDPTNGNGSIFLEVGLPFLAGTYDERMYEELRLRAQIFEVLTGGSVTVDADANADAQNLEGHDDVRGAEGKEAGIRFVPLPDDMLDSLRVNLHVWSPDR